MRTIADHLLRPHGNVEEIVLRILQESDVRTTRSMAVRRLHDHPSFPSLSAVSDVLWHYGIETLSLRVDDLDQIGTFQAFFPCADKLSRAASVCSGLPTDAGFCRLV